MSSATNYGASSSHSFATAPRGYASRSTAHHHVAERLHLPLTQSHDNYFGGEVVESPAESDDDDDDDVHSDSTCEDDEMFGFGAPLERMPRQYSGGGAIIYDMQHQVSALLKVSPCSSGVPSRTGSFVSECSSFSYDTIDYEQVINDMISEVPNPFLRNGSRNLVTYKSPPGLKLPQSVSKCPPLMVKTLPRSASELLLLLELNHPDSREDPWNPVPHILSAVERPDSVYLCMQGLSEFNEPPLLTVAHYIDFFRQVLEGLTFLHEQRVAGLSCAEPSSYMVDLSSAPHGLMQGDSSRFDRFSFPVRYYFVNFSQASRVHREMRSPMSNPGTPGDPRRRPLDPFKQDVQDLGTMLDRLLLEVPQVSQKFKPLIRAMTLGGFAADDARKLFEALCRTIEAHIFESKAALFSKRSAPERAHTLSHPHSANKPSPRFPPLEKICSH